MKLQILELPTEYNGEYSHTPYALIVSEVPSESCGPVADTLNGMGIAKWVFVTDFEVEL